MPNKNKFDDILPDLGQIKKLEWNPRDTKVRATDLSEQQAVGDIEDRIQSIQDRYESDPDGSKLPVGIPNSAEDKAAVEALMQEVRDEIDRTAARIQSTQEAVDRASGITGSGSRFVMNIDDRRDLRRAMRKIFGGKHDSITPEHYKAAIKMKAELEDKSAKKHTRG